VEITSIDHLERLTAEELQEIQTLIKVREPLIQQMYEDGKRTGLTLDEYNKAVSGLTETSCKKCEGTGRLLPKKPRTVGVIHPSSADKCVLALYYDVTGELAPQDSISPELAFTFAMGHALHDVIQQTLHRAFHGEFVDEAPIDIVGLIKGHTDGILFLNLVLRDGRQVRVKTVLEIKTAGPSTYDKLSSPVKEHRIQAHGLYATALDSPFVVYLYVSKIWPHPMKEFVEAYDPGIFYGWLKRKGLKVEKALADRKAGAKWPEPVADANPSECGQCSYESSCPSSLAKKRNVFSRVSVTKTRKRK
jgi:hypothetical protein